MFVYFLKAPGSILMGGKFVEIFDKDAERTIQPHKFYIATSIPMILRLRFHYDLVSSPQHLTFSLHNPQEDMGESPFKSYVSGTFAGICGVLVGHPADSIKVTFCFCFAALFVQNFSKFKKQKKNNYHR